MSTRELNGGDRQARLLSVVDCGLLSVLFVAPFFMGGRHPLGQLVYVGVVCVTAVAWALHKALGKPERWLWSWSFLLIPCGGLLLFLQQLALPSSWVLPLSPQIGNTLQFWFDNDAGSSAGLGSWNTLSLFPDATKGALVLFLAHAMLFLVVFQRLQEIEDIERILRWVALAVVAMAVLGLAQFLTSNGKFLWVYQHPFRDTFRITKGTFSNENHFAHFLALGVGPLLWWLQQTLRNSQPQSKRTRNRRGWSSRSRTTSLSNRYTKPALMIALGLVLFAGFLSFSKGGMLVLLLAVVVCLSIFAWKKLFDRKSLVALIGCAVFLGIALSIYGYAPMVKEFSKFGAGTVESVDQNAMRRKLWDADLQAFSRFPIFGTGGGTHAEVYPMFYEHYSEVVYTHAESGYVQIVLEYGVVGATLLALAIAFWLFWSMAVGLARASDVRIAACAGPVVAALVASLTHSIWDFVWFIPACMSLTIVMAASACRLRQLAKSTVSVQAEGEFQEPRAVHPLWGGMRRLGWLGATACFVALSCWMIGNRIPSTRAVPHWDQYCLLMKAIQADPETTNDKEANALLIEYLEATLARNPKDARAHRRLAGAYLRQFEFDQAQSENPMPLAQVQEAVLASNFAGPSDRDNWLSIALGENRAKLDKALEHARRTLLLCPLKGKGYVYLSQLTFLFDNSTPTKQQCIDQALRVRPHDGFVLMAAGQEAVLSGDVPRALSLWKRAFHQSPEIQQRLIETLAPQASASLFLEHFDPDFDGLHRIYAYYRHLGRKEEARTIAAPYLRELTVRADREAGEAAARTWRKVYAVHRFLENHTQALDAIRQAVERAPYDLALRQTLATELMHQGKFEEAADQVKWCLYRKPQDRYLQGQLLAARRRSLEVNLEQ